MKMYFIRTLTVVAILGILLGYRAIAEDGVSIRLSAETLDLTYALVDEAWEEAGFQYVNTSFSVRIQNYDALSTIYDTDPTWAFVQTGGESMEAGYDYRLSCNRNYIWVYFNMPEDPLEASFEVRCEWGGETTIVPVSVRFVEQAMPTVTDVSGMIDLPLNQPLRVAPGFEPEFMEVGETEVYFSSYYDEGVEVVQDEANPNVWFLIGKQPGYYTGSVRVSQGDLSYFRDIAFCVHNADGSADPLEFGLRLPETEITRFITPREWQREGANVDRMTSTGSLAMVCAKEYGVYEALYGAPEWSVSDDSGGDPGFYIDWDNGNLSGYECGPVLCMKSMPERPMDVNVHITLSWGEYMDERDILIHFLEAPDMDVTVPSIINMQTGETRTFEIAFTPALSGAKHEVFNAEWDMDYDEYDDDEDSFGVDWDLDWSQPDRITLHAEKPGVYVSYINVVDTKNQILYQKMVTVHVSDESGGVPAPQIEFERESDETEIAIAPLGERMDAPYSASEIKCDVISISRYDTLSGYYGGMPVWSYEQVSGEPINASISGDECPVLTLLAMPEEPMTAVLRLTCNWGNSTATADWTLNFRTCIKPLSVVSSSIITLSTDGYINEPISLLLDNGSTAQFSIDSIVLSREGVIAKFDFGGWLIKGGYGYVDALVTFGSNNIRFCKQMTFRIPDKQGNIPGLSTLALPSSLKSIEAEAFSGTVAERIILPKGCISIANKAFSDCDQLVEIVVPRTVANISEDAFSGISPVLVVKAGSNAERIAKERGWRYTRG